MNLGGITLENLVSLRGNITTNQIYILLLEELNQYCKSNMEPPIFDLREVTFIEPEAVPLLITVGEYFSRRFHSQIPMLLKERSKLQNFLINIGFFNVAIEKKYYKFDQNYMDNWLYNIRDVHKMILLRPAFQYTDVREINDIEVRRDYLLHNIRKNIMEQCWKILSDIHKLPENLMNDTIDGLAETLTNASMYSESDSYAYLASDKYGTKASISDCGVGLQKSYMEQGYQFTWYECEDVRKNPELKSYYIIMEILDYSFNKHKVKERADLWTVKDIVISYGGTFKVHFGNIQVIFTGDRCKGCDKIECYDAKKNKKVPVSDTLQPCLDCLRRDYSESQYSPIKYHNIAFRGVHIEFEIPRG